MRISKTTAESVAKAVFAKKLTAIEATEKKAKIYVSELVIAYTPYEVIELSNKHPNFFKFSYSFRFQSANSSEMDYTYYKSAQKLPETGNFLNISVAEFKKLQKEWLKYDQLRTDYKNAIRELETALMQLITYKRIREALPEIAGFLPAETSTALIPNIDKVRDLIRG